MKGILTLTMAMSVQGWEPVDAPIGNARAIVAAVIIGEAVGEGHNGMRAVYEVIHTRASHRGTSCLTEVMRKSQFDSITKYRSNPFGLVRRWRKDEPVNYAWVYHDLLKGVPITMLTVQDNAPKLNTNRADHFYAHDGKYKIPEPRWFKGIKGKVIGNHKFYKLTK
tara:strand:+ start:168 stop:665 length:498 start_codon:yes stop_codon:yes gene_type:complete